MRLKVLKSSNEYIIDLLGKIYINLRNIRFLIYRIEYKLETKIIKILVYTFIMLVTINYIKINGYDIVSYLIRNKEMIYSVINNINDYRQEILNIILILSVITTCSLKRSLRRKLKEDNYHYIVDNYLELRSILIEAIYINEENEKLLLTSLDDCKNELKEIEARYKDYSFIFLSSSRYIEDMKMIKSELNSISTINNLKDYDLNPNEELLEFKRVLTSNSRINIISSIDKKLLKQLYHLSNKKIIELIKDNIADGIIRRGKDYDILIENLIIHAFVNKYEILRIIKKIDKKIGINKKENNMFTMLKTYTDSFRI